MNENKRNGFLYGAFYVLSILLIIFYFKKCGVTHPVLGGQSDQDTVTIVRLDTNTITHIDTIHFYDTVKRYINIYIQIPSDTVIDSVVYAEYNNQFSDSLIDGVIYSRVKGELVAQNFEYTPKFPKYIIRTDSVIIEKETKQIINHNELYVGLMVGGNGKAFGLGPSIHYRTKKKILLTGYYDMIGETYNIGASFRLAKF